MMKHLFLSVTILAARPISTAAQVKGGWTYDSTKDEMTDEVRFLISTNSRPIYNDRGGLTIGMIGWRCSAITGREVLIVMDRYFGGNVDNQVIVETRLDSARSDSGWWSLSANKQGAFMPTEDISNFTSHVETSRRLLVRVTDPLDGEAITYFFNVVGFGSAYRRLEPKCPKEEARTPEILPASPRWIVFMPPGAPREVRGKRYEVRFWVAADGHVTRVEVTPEIEDERYRRKFIERMMGYLFNPATTRDGTHVDFVASLTVIP